MLISGSLGHVIVSTLVQNARDVGSIHALGSHFHHLHDTGYCDPDSVEARHCMVVEPTLGRYIYIVQ